MVCLQNNSANYVEGANQQGSNCPDYTVQFFCTSYDVFQHRRPDHLAHQAFSDRWLLVDQTVNLQGLNKNRIVNQTSGD